VIAAEPITDVNTTAADVLEELDAAFTEHGTGRALTERGVRLIFAELKDPVRSKLKQYELDRPLAPDRFSTIR